MNKGKSNEHANGLAIPRRTNSSTTQVISHRIKNNRGTSGEGSKIRRITKPADRKRASSGIPIRRNEQKSKAMSSGTSTNKRKKDKIELSVAMSEVLNNLIDKDTDKTFSTPVDTKIFFDYTKKIAKPMDLQTMQNNVKKYSGFKDFEADLSLIWSNCRLYNLEDSNIVKTSQLLESFSKKFIKQFIGKFRKQHNLDEDGVPIKSDEPQVQKRRKPNNSNKQEGHQTSRGSSKKQAANGTARDTSPSFDVGSSATGGNSRSNSKGGNSLNKAIQKSKKSNSQAGAVVATIPAGNQKSRIKKEKRNSQQTNGGVGNGSTTMAGTLLTLNSASTSGGSIPLPINNWTMIGLQQHMVSRENLISEEDKVILSDKLSSFSQEELFKCIKVIQEFEPQQISSQTKEQYTVSLGSITKTTFNKIRDQFSF